MPNLRDRDGAQMIKGGEEGISRTVARKTRPQEENNIYVFGPVPSRRLGKSLGIDLVPLKTCTFNCIYCQLGQTTNRTICRKPYVSGKAVIRQLEEKLSSLSEKPDYITFSGSGEPTLNSELGWVIEQINSLTKIPTAVLTNGSLLHLESVRRALREVDLVIPSLDAGNAHLFRMINRPHPSLNFSQILRGLEEFRKEFGGAIWLEVMLCGGMNDDPKEILRIRDLMGKIGPDRIQLNTVYRPPAEDFALPLPPGRLEAVRAALGDRAEIIPESNLPFGEKPVLHQEDILTLLQRRPCTAEDLSRALGLKLEEVLKTLGRLTQGKILTYKLFHQKCFYEIRV
jgi:wyosine [tRNA(Phe)-imidazoG37] synthetase (radical SAM superfamily)